MRAELYPTNRDPLRRLGTMSLVAGLLGVVAIIYSMVHFVRGRTTGEEWILGVGFCLLFGAAMAGIIHGVLAGHQAWIEALEKRAADGTPS